MMQVETIRATPEPEKLVAQAARGDYYDGFVADTDYDELMASVQYDESHVEAVAEIFDYTFGEDVDSDVISPETELRARQYALLERLFRRGHFGPYEHPQITLGIEGISRSCMAQLTRHRHASWDVQSQRYVDFSEKDQRVLMPDSLADPEHVSRETGEVDLDEHDRQWFSHEYNNKVNEMFNAYERMVDSGVPKEDARFVLPIGTVVNLTGSLNARTLLHIANLREKANSQWELRSLTTKIIDEEFANWMPMTHHLWREHGPTQISP